MEVIVAIPEPISNLSEFLSLPELVVTSSGREQLLETPILNKEIPVLMIRCINQLSI